MKSTIITILLAVAALTVQAQTKVWDNIIMGYANAPIIRSADGLQSGNSPESWWQGI